MADINTLCTIDETDLAKWVGSTKTENSENIKRIFEDAKTQVGEALARVPNDEEWPQPSESTVNMCVLKVGHEIWAQKSAPGGVQQQYSSLGEGVQPVRLARDPMIAARPYLKKYLPGGFA